VNDRDTEMLLAGAALGIGAALLYHASRIKKIAAAANTNGISPQPPLASGVSLVSSGAVTITLSPGIQTISQALDVNTAVIVYLPAGAQWQSMDGAGITDRTSPQAFVFNGPISHTFAWTDATNTAQLCTVYLTVAAAPQSVTT
jgi:hypothetical protein